ncbi:MAG: bifunctional phosphopantothenoylcysteine decarboxylase/phosphopantothenate--cysteine ligase CoaBC [Bacteroidales bacterium]|nr:bifunctional phosphopantothenoylcysteine decarboxylase/phosphopantothenate--cysteine ligase CoaBC [Bacteroidales bacterium]MBN2817367.1 bifunctional phosphopantothenoylcysteine decarboxylase/phosphopantothenate--cysteine ligase CoaBC [Bacteroidales bacterium]
MLKDKNIILGITGSIAAYKAAILVRLLIKQGANVKVIMTPLAKEFITPLTLATLSKNPILVDFFNPENGDWNSHVDLGLWADAYLIAPATANTIAKMATGIADNLLLTTYLSARCPVFVAPAMDLDMYQHQTTQKNIEILKSFGNQILEPATGELASGLEGKGRMDEPENIVSALNTFFQKKKLSEPLKGKRILITAGPTHELIDPVRFIGNYSSGKMGYALAEQAALMGADVTLVSGPVSISCNQSAVKVLKVRSAEEMHNQVKKLKDEAKIIILAAAVADFTPEEVSDKKIKDKTKLILNLKPTVDIAFELGKTKKQDQKIIGFALETHNEVENATNKLQKKNFDLIVLNSLKHAGAGFQHDTNKISIIDRHNNVQNFELKSKRDVAFDILEAILKLD